MDTETVTAVVGGLMGTLLLVAGVDFGVAWLMRASSEAASRD